jgi:choice-of-anchor B domain-containing protein
MTNHTIDINTATGFAYLNGGLGSVAGGQPVVFDINNPTVPVPLGVTHDDGYTHDSHCRIYKGPDKAHKGGEICFNANEDTVTIYDMTNKMNPTRLARVGYKNATYTHQAWLTKDHRHILVADEIDEQTHGIKATTYIFDVTDLEKPKLVDTYVAPTKAIDHNNYIIGDINYAAKYTAGLRIEDISKVSKGKIREIGYFDVMPESDLPDYDGVWSVYPFLPSGNVILSGMGQGFFIVKPKL